jgi:2,4-dienoyl-CoA reductase-like NADH-dependent reductase (Old Yellow Enzyme family)/thioredoxin reductase
MQIEGDFKELFKPAQIGSLELRNRIMLPPHGMPIGDLWGTDDQARTNVAYWASRAQDGAAWIGGLNGFVEPTLIPGFLPTGIGARARGIFRLPHFHERARMYADAIHEAGAVATIQFIMQAGKPYGPSAVMPNYTDNTVPHVLTTDEIRWLVEEYAYSAELSQKAGLDGVELHANHEDILQLFMSPATNLRDDDYGGDAERRLRFVKDILHAIRERTGDGFTIGVRFNMDELFEGGYDLNGGIEIARALASTGNVDYLHCVMGNNWGAPSYIQPHHYQAAQWSELAGRYRATLDIPVVYAGRVDSPEAAEKVLADGHADVVGIARAMFADANIISKARSGNSREILPCIGCNDCLHTRVVEGLPFGCSVNPRTGRELAEPQPAETAKRVLVVGAGPAGLELAVSCAERGHQVELWEARDEVGGQMRLAGGIEEHGSFLRFIDFQARRLESLGVKIATGVTADVETVIAANADVVALATGASGSVPEVSGAHLPFVFDSHAALQDLAALGQDVVVVALEDHMQPLVVARHLSDAGKRVNVVYQTHAIAPLVGKYSVGATLSRLNADGVKFQVMERVTSIEQGRLTLKHVYSGMTSELSGFDSVVFSTGGHANDALFHALRARHDAVHVLGDAYAPRRIWFATRQAYELAQRI